MATKETKAPTETEVQTAANEGGPNAPGAMSAGSAAERDPNEIDKTLKSEAVKVTDGEALSVFDPHYGQGGAYVINEEGIRVPAV